MVETNGIDGSEVIGVSHPSMKNKAGYYGDAIAYWNAIEATNNGMLGGFEQLTIPDTVDSLKFISDYLPNKNKLNLDNNNNNNEVVEKTRCCDCGAGIGRVSKNFLLRCFDIVDIVEQNSSFVEKAKLDLPPSRVGKFHNVGLQDFIPDNGVYDLIWCQWVLGHLTDQDLVEFLKRCKNGLKPNGLVGLKENISSSSSSSPSTTPDNSNSTSSGNVLFDEVDSSVTRSDGLFQSIIKAAGFIVIKETLQTKFPSGLFRVKMYLLKPI